MTITINGTTGITNDGGYTGDGVVFADTTPANTLVTTTGGNVGIGTSSPTQKLDVRGIVRVNEDNAGTKVIQLRSDWAGVDPAIQVVTNNPLLFVTNGSERARIDSSGNLLVGATAAIYSSRMRVHGGIASTGSVQFNIDGTSATNFEWVLRLGAGMQFYVNNASVVGTLTASGVWTNASDARYKENIRPVTYGLAEVMQLQPRAYNIIGSEKQEIGFVAQEVEPLIPELVESSTNSVTEEDRLTLSYGQMSAVLVKAIQEQQAIITALTARVTALEGTTNV